MKMAFCKNCGTQLKEGAAFCKNCGTPVGTDSKPKNETPVEYTYDYESSASDLQKKAMEAGAAGAQQAKKIGAAGAKQAQKIGSAGFARLKEYAAVYKAKVRKDRRMQIGTGVAVAAVVLLIVIGVVVANSAKSVNLENMIAFSVEGVDQKGTAYCSLDEDAFTAAVIKARGGKVPSDPTSPAWSEASEQYQVSYLMSLVTLTVEDNANLSNGDKVTVTIEYDGDAAKRCGIRFKGDSAQFTVAGLEELIALDPFENLTVTFEGIAPNAYASLSYDGDDGYLSEYNFYTDNGENLDKGDTVTVYAQWDEAEELGYYLSETEKEYTCEDVAAYLSTLSELEDSAMTQLQSEASDCIESYFAGEYEEVSYTGLKYEGAYLLNAKESGSYYSNNLLYLVYSAKVTENGSSPEYKKKQVYLPIYFYNVVINIDQSVSYDMDDDIQGSTSLSVGWSRLPGYESYSAMYNALVVSRKKDYTYETSEEFGGEASTDDEDDAEDTDYILPTSNSAYLTVEDLEGLSKEECRLARNELYARYGRTFDDEELQEYFDSKEWYTRSPKGTDINDSVLNDYEIANRDLIIQYEKDMGYR
jgi:uncharacterized Zn finger protein (UPF0148 family)